VRYQRRLVMRGAATTTRMIHGTSREDSTVSVMRSDCATREAALAHSALCGSPTSVYAPAPERPFASDEVSGSRAA